MHILIILTLLKLQLDYLRKRISLPVDITKHQTTENYKIVLTPRPTTVHYRQHITVFVIEFSAPCSSGCKRFCVFSSKQLQYTSIVKFLEENVHKCLHPDEGHDAKKKIDNEYNYLLFTQTYVHGIFNTAIVIGPTQFEHILVRSFKTMYSYYC